MPANITPVTITLDKVRIEQFTVDAQRNTLTIYYTKGYEDGSGNFVVVDHARADVGNFSVDATLYDDVKAALYAILDEHLNSAS